MSPDFQYHELIRQSGMDLLQKAQASAAEPDYPLVHAAMAGAWSLLGYDAKAKEEAKRIKNQDGESGAD